MNINDYLTSLDDQFTNLFHDDPQSYILDYKKMNIYNKNIQHPLNKIWLLTPKLKLSGKIYIPNKQKQVAIMSLVLYELDDDIKQFIECIKRIENYVSLEMTNLGHHELTLKSCIRASNNFFPLLTLQMPFDTNANLEFPFGIYNTKNKMIKYNEIENGNFIGLYLELCDVWMNSKEYGINWKILQMKAYPEFDFTKCVFNDIDYVFVDDEPELLIPPAPLMSKFLFTDEQKTPEHKSYIPTIDELVNIKSKLKSIKPADVPDVPIVKKKLKKKKIKKVTQLEQLS